MGLFRWHYAHGKFSEALGSMAESSGTLAKRLASAYKAYLSVLQKSDVPDELWNKFEGVRDAMATHPARWDGEGSADASLAAIHPKKIKRLIETIASIEYQLVHVYDERVL
jgi:hypothetical protein